MTTDPDARYRAVQARDARFDGMFVTAVRTTGVYCRPSCPARTPRPENVEFHRTAAAAEEAGFRACRRCRPDVTPGSPEWDVRADVVARAVRLIHDGVVERDGVEGLADRLGFSVRHVHRMISEELGVGPLALARSARARTARTLVESTDLPLGQVAFAAGYASIRQFNDSFRASFDRTPSSVRAARRRPGSTAGAAAGVLDLRLAVRQPFHADALAGFLVDHAVPGLERGDGRTFARVLDLPHGPGVAALTLHDDHVACRLQLTDPRDTAVAVARLRRLLDLDADPVAIDDALRADPGLAPLVDRSPGLRVPGTVDAVETALRTVVGQQVSVAGAATVLGRLVRLLGEPVELPLATEHGLDHAFPRPEVLAAADTSAWPMPTSRRDSVVRLARAVVDGDVPLDPGVDRAQARADLLALRGIGPWTADYVLMRGLGDPDVLLETDLVLRRELAARDLDAHATADWRPWRSYAGMHLWRAATTLADERISA